MTKHWVSNTCKGENCQVCAEPAAHKVSEVIAYDDPQPVRHELTSYLCCLHYSTIMGEAARKICILGDIRDRLSVIPGGK